MKPKSCNIPTSQLRIDGYSLFSKCRDHRRGSGVAVYVKEGIPAKQLDSITVPEQLECLWIKVRSNKLPRGISSIIVCAVYISLNSPFQQTLVDHLLQEIDCVRTHYPDTGIVILGDFNRMCLTPIVRGNDLYQIVDFHTRREVALDPILTNHAVKSV